MTEVMPCYKAPCALSLSAGCEAMPCYKTGSGIGCYASCEVVAFYKASSPLSLLVVCYGPRLPMCGVQKNECRSFDSAERRFAQDDRQIIDAQVTGSGVGCGSMGRRGRLVWRPG